VNHKGCIVPYKDLLAEVCGAAYLDATDSLYLYIHYLREKLEENPGEPQYIRIKRGIGYWFASAEGYYEEDTIIR